MIKEGHVELLHAQNTLGMDGARGHLHEWTVSPCSHGVTEVRREALARQLSLTLEAPVITLGC